MKPITMGAEEAKAARLKTRNARTNSAEEDRDKEEVVTTKPVD
jgi:hypothetical protein